MRLSRSPEFKSSGALTGKALALAWDHLDPGFGAKLQVTYTGGHNPQVHLAGKILGVREPREVDLGNRPTGLDFWMKVLVIPLMALILIPWAVLELRSKTSLKLDLWSILGLVFILLILWFVSLLEVPFGLDAPL